MSWSYEPCRGYALHEMTVLTALIIITITIITIIIIIIIIIITITEPLAKVQCVYPSLLEDVRTASWSAMKFALDVEKDEKKARYAERARIAELEGTSIASSVVAWQHKAFDINTDNILHQRLKEVYISSGFSKQEVEEMDRINQAVMNDDDNHDRDLPLDAVHGGGMMEMSQLSLEESVASTMGPESPDRPSGGQTADNAIKSFDRAVLYRNANKRRSVPPSLPPSPSLCCYSLTMPCDDDNDGDEYTNLLLLCFLLFLFIYTPYLNHSTIPPTVQHPARTAVSPYHSG